MLSEPIRASAKTTELALISPLAVMFESKNVPPSDGSIIKSPTTSISGVVSKLNVNLVVPASLK